WVLCACSERNLRTETKTSVESHQFFENSTRRDATDLEARRVAYVADGCTAFFLENTANKTYLASARHCFDYSITNWCETDGLVQDNDGQRGHCVGIVAADLHHDIAVFEANIPHPSTGASTLQLSPFVPPVGTRLVMTGYPFDQDPVLPRNGMLTTT